MRRVKSESFMYLFIALMQYYLKCNFSSAVIAISVCMFPYQNIDFYIT